MSADYLKIIPTDVHYVPPAKARKLAIEHLKRLLPEGEEFTAEVYKQVQFIDQGENLEAVICPACQQRLELSHVNEYDAVTLWWYDLSDLMGEESVESATAIMPCCAAIVSVLDLQFDWPAGFARFELFVVNPNVGENLSAAQLAELEAILGCKLMQVRAHY